MGLVMRTTFIFFSIKRRQTRCSRDLRSDVWSADLVARFFFFQAEDGIRDVAVTGVQTCALPISLAAARALVAHSDLDAKGIVTDAMRIAASICVYTNDHISVEVL